MRPLPQARGQTLKLLLLIVDHPLHLLELPLAGCSIFLRGCSLCRDDSLCLEGELLMLTLLHV